MRNLGVAEGVDEAQVEVDPSQRQHGTSADMDQVDTQAGGDGFGRIIRDWGGVGCYASVEVGFLPALEFDTHPVIDDALGPGIYIVRARYFIALAGERFGL